MLNKIKRFLDSRYIKLENEKLKLRNEIEQLRIKASGLADLNREYVVTINEIYGLAKHNPSETGDKIKNKIKEIDRKHRLLYTDNFK